MSLVGRPWWPASLPRAPTIPKFGIWAILVSIVLFPWVMACPKLVCLGAWASFDQFQPNSQALIGYAFCLDLWSVFPCSQSVFSFLFHLHTNNYQHSWKL